MKRKGFTLVELLAVIVILAIIALITTVVVINIVETVKIRKYKVEEKSLEKAAELYYTNSQIFPFQDEISLNTLVEKGFINSVKDTGNGSTCEGKVIKDNNGELKGCLKCSNYVTEGCGYVIEQEIKDENPGVICGNGTEEDYDKQEECHIKSVEDLVAFSYLVNSGKTFEGKTVYLDKDLDITNYAKEKSYVDPDKKVLYDINGDGEKTSLKDEMTTDKGFQPIGTNEKEKKEKKFKGKFEGKAYTISNLMINRPDEDYVGLFGYVTGDSDNYATIVGLNIENINVKGKNYVGGVVGYAHSYADINEVMVSGNVLGEANNIGGIVGSVTTINVRINSVIVNANVTGNSNVGGISGGPFSNSANVTAIIEGGTITGNDKVYATSYWNTSSNMVKTAYVNSKVKVIKNSKEVTGYYGGTLYNDDETGNINLYNDYIDTWLGGDNDGSGYYFDYESETSNKIVLRSTEKYPINTIFEKGSGTKEDPYLIYNENDMKKIAAMPKERNYYKLMNDIDYNNKHYYMIGTSTNVFSGMFDGGAHTLKNINIYGYNYIGLFGCVMGSYTQYSTITGLNVENIKVKGNNYVGGLSGYINYAKINEVTLTGTIIGNEKTGMYIGGIVGSVNTNNVYIKSVIVNANVTGDSNVGGISGGPFSNSANVTAIIEGGTITGNDKVYATSYWNTSSNMVKTAYVNSKVKVIKNSEEVTGYYGGTEFSESYYNNLQYYGNLKLSSKVVIETPYSGDIDASGYYFDYNNDGTDIIVVKANNSSQSSTTGNVVYTKTVTEGDDKEAPKCTLGRYSVHGNGFTASYTCTDNTKVKARKHIYWVSEPNKVNYEDLISWPSTTDSSSETVSSVWTVESANSIGIEPPSKESCYYFYYGAQDEAGNTVIYATPNCISY